MAQLETDALVLESRAYRETSLLATLLTRDRGRVGAMVRGARRGKSSLASALQPLTLLRVRLAMSGKSEGGLAALASADIVWQPPFAHLLPQTSAAERSTTLARMAYAGLFAEILTHGEENDPHAEELFGLSRDFLMGLSATPHPGSHAVAGLFALLGSLGFAPQPPDSDGPVGVSTDADAPPAAPADTERSAFYGVDLLGGTIAPGFAGPPGRCGERFVVLTGEETAALVRLLGGYASPDSGGQGEFVVGRRTGAALLRLAVRLFETHLECRLRSAKFLEEMILG